MANTHEEIQKQYIPKLYENDAALQTLSLGNSGCHDVYMTALADALRVNTTVIEIDLSNNNITDEGARFLGETLLSNKTLASLNLDGNRIGTSGYLCLAEAMRQNTSLKVLSLENNTPTDGQKVSDEAVIALETMIKLNNKPPKVKRLFLEMQEENNKDLATQADAAKSAEHSVIDFSLDATVRCTEHDPKAHLDDYCAEVLARILKGNRTVKEVNLSFHHITDVGASHLASMLRHNSTITKLSLVGNQMTDIGAAEFLQTLDEDNNSIEHLLLFDNIGVSSDTVAKVEYALALNRQPMRFKKYFPMLKRNDPELKFVDFDDHLSQRFVDDITARMIRDALLTNTYLVSIVLSNGHITSIGAAFLGELLEANTNLQHLDLSHNPLGDGGRFLAKALGVNHKLFSLSLADTQLTEDAAKDIASMLEINTTLTSLDLSDNPHIGPSGAAFAYAFNVNKYLVDFVLDGCDVSEKVKRTIEARRAVGLEPDELQSTLPLVYEANERVTKVNLDGNHLAGGRRLTDSSLQLLSPPLQSNYYITELNLSHNEISFTGIVELMGALQQNRVTLKDLDLSHNPIHRGAQFGKLLGGLIATHITLQRLNVASTGLDNNGVQYMISELDVPKINQLKWADISGNDIDKMNHFIFHSLLECNSYNEHFKVRFRTVFRVWITNEARVLPTPTLDFSDYFPDEEAEQATPTEQCDAVVQLLKKFLVKTQVKTLNISRMGLGNQGIAGLEDFLSTSKFIESVDFTGNRIGSDGIRSIAATVKKNYRLQDLKVQPQAIGHGRGISAEALHLLDEMIYYNKQPRDVKTLLVQLNENAIDIMDESWRAQNQINDGHMKLICRELKVNNSITEINLSNNYISAVGFEALLDVLHGTKRVKKLVLRNTLIQGDVNVGKKVAAFIESGAVTEVIDLSFNDCDNSFVPPVLAALDQNDSLRRFSVEETGIASHLQMALATRISLNTEATLKDTAAQLRNNEWEKEILDLSQTKYSENQFIELFAALEDNKTVTEVRISYCHLSDDCGGALLNPMMRNHHVQRLHLDNNEFGPKTVMSLCRLLRMNTTIEFIDISENKFPPGALQPIRHVIDENESVGRLIATAPEDEDISFLDRFQLNRQPTIKRALSRLANNDRWTETLDASTDAEITDLGIKALEEALMYNTVLKELNLSYGLISDEGCRCLQRILMRSQSITKVNVSFNKFTDVGVQDLADVVKVSRTLQFLDISGNKGVTAKGIRSLKAACLLSTSLIECGVDDIPEELGDADDLCPNRPLKDVVFLNNRAPLLKHVILGEDTNITELDFHGLQMPATEKGFDDDAFLLLSHALAHNSQVRYLNVANNGLTLVSASAAANLLSTNTSIRMMDASGNQFGDSAMLVVDALLKNDSITGLDLDRNGVPALTLERMELYLSLNREPIALKQLIVDLTERRAEPREICLNMPPVTTQKLLQIEAADKEIEDSEPSIGVSFTPQELRTKNVEDIAGIERKEFLLQRTRNLLTLRKSCLDSGSVDLLCEVLKTNLSVRLLNLSWNAINSKGVKRICKMISDNPGMLEIHLNHNSINDEGAIALAQLLKESSTLQLVSLNNNLLVTGAAAPQIVDALTTNNNAVAFNAKGCQLPSTDTATLDFLAKVNAVCWGKPRRAFVGVFRNDPDCDTMDLSSLVASSMVVEKVLSLVPLAVRQCTNTTSLLLEYNDLADKDLNAVINAIQSWPSLTALSLACNNLEEVGPLARLLHTNTHLQSLDLRGNKLGVSSARSIAEMLRANDCLTTLDVSKNEWGRVGASLILGALPMNDKLQSIELHGPDIPEDVVQRAQNALTLHYRQISLTDDAVADVGEEGSAAAGPLKEGEVVAQGNAALMLRKRSSASTADS